MNDIVGPGKRSRMMASVRSENTRPEMLVRRGLHRLGFRFRLHVGKLPGRPDLVLPKYRVAIFVHGCFWHRHSGCKYVTSPKNRSDFWRAKFEANIKRDHRNSRALLEDGWRVFIVWECALRHAPDRTIAQLSGLVTDENFVCAELPSPKDA